VQESIAQLTKDLSAAQEKLLQAEQMSGQRMDELEAAHAQLQVTVLFSQPSSLYHPSAYRHDQGECKSLHS